MLKQKGFTLIEIIIVVVIMGVLGFVAVRMLPKRTVSLHAQAKNVADDLRYAQHLSMTKGQRYRFVKISGTSYQILDSSGTAVANPEGNTTTALTDGVTFGTFTNLPNNLIVFNGAGEPYVDVASPGTPLANTATIPLVSGSDTKNIQISPETGKVTV